MRTLNVRIERIIFEGTTGTEAGPPELKAALELALRGEFGGPERQSELVDRSQSARAVGVAVERAVRAALAPLSRRP